MATLKAVFFTDICSEDLVVIHGSISKTHASSHRTFVVKLRLLLLLPMINNITSDPCVHFFSVVLVVLVE